MDLDLVSLTIQKSTVAKCTEYCVIQNVSATQIPHQTFQ